MKQSGTFRAIAELERRAAASVWSARLRAAQLVRDRARLIAANAAERLDLTKATTWSSLDCYMLATRTTWTAANASALISAARSELARASAIAQERWHWAACRRGLERRAARASRGPCLV